MADSTNNINIQISDGVDAAIAPKLISIADGAERAEKSVGSLKAQLASIQASGLGSLSYQLNSVQGSIGKTTASTHNLTNSFYAAQGASRLFAGQIPTRAFERFIATSETASTVLLKAFPLIGAIAMGEVLYRIGESFYKTIEQAKNASHEIAKAFDSITNPLRRTNDELQLTNDKLDTEIAKLEHRPTTNGAALALDEARVMADKLEESLERVSNELDNILKKNQVSIPGGLLTNQGTTKDTSKFLVEQFNQINKAKDEAQAAIDKATASGDAKASHVAMVQAYENERTAIKGVTQAIVERYNATQELQKSAGSAGTNALGLLSSGQAAPDQTANLTELGKAGHLAQQELRNLDLTMSNMEKNKALDHLKDQANNAQLAAKQAAAEWKQLEADFVKFQSDSLANGHKLTPQEDLNWLKSHEATVNPLNRDRLAAKELPFENKIAGDNWIEEQTQRLTDQVSTIGLYSNALKEAAASNRLFEEASRRNVTLSDEVKNKFKELIETVVEHQEYGRQLESIYRSVNDAAMIFESRVQAVTSLYQQGALSQDQYSQGISETIKEYNEASDAVARFKRELSDAQRDAANSLGTQQQIAVKSVLQSLNEQLRKPGADSEHPFGYSEEEIQKINAQLSPLIEAQQRLNNINSEANSIINQQANLIDELSVRESALNEALKAGALSQDAYNAEQLKMKIALNDQQLERGTITSGKQPYIGAIMDYAKQFTSVAKGIKDTFSGVFKTLSDGFADTIGRWIAQGGNLKEMLKNVAREGIGEIISGLIKLGIQQVINLTLGTAMASAATAAGVAQAAILTSAWTPAAYAASVASFGAADAAGTAAYSSGLATVTALSAIPKLATGTNYLPQDMLIYAHQGEAVIPAADNRQLIDALQGARALAPSRPQFEIHNYSGHQISYEQMTDNRVRMIVHAEGPSIVAKHAPGVIADELGNPNSKPSKAVTRNYAPRNRS